MGLGLRRGTVALEPHSKEWEITAQQSIDRLREILRDAAVDVQHIGSTAISGICAKPIIDLVVGTADFQAVLARNSVLAENGFLFRGQDYPEQYLYVCGEGEIRTHHIHVVLYQSVLWRQYIDLRDYLNCHPADAQAYAAWKETLAEQYAADRNTYTAMKNEMIRALLTKAQDWRRGVICGKTGPDGNL